MRQLLSHATAPNNRVLWDCASSSHLTRSTIPLASLRLPRSTRECALSHHLFFWQIQIPKSSLYHPRTCCHVHAGSAAAGNDASDRTVGAGEASLGDAEELRRRQAAAARRAADKVIAAGVALQAAPSLTRPGMSGPLNPKPLQRHLPRPPAAGPPPMVAPASGRAAAVTSCPAAVQLASGAPQAAAAGGSPDLACPKGLGSTTSPAMPRVGVSCSAAPAAGGASAAGVSCGPAAAAPAAAPSAAAAALQAGCAGSPGAAAAAASRDTVREAVPGAIAATGARAPAQIPAAVPAASPPARPVPSAVIARRTVPAAPMPPEGPAPAPAPATASAVREAAFAPPEPEPGNMPRSRRSGAASSCGSLGSGCGNLGGDEEAAAPCVEDIAAAAVARADLCAFQVGHLAVMPSKQCPAATCEKAGYDWPYCSRAWTPVPGTHTPETLNYSLIGCRKCKQEKSSMFHVERSRSSHQCEISCTQAASSRFPKEVAQIFYLVYLVSDL